MGRYAQARRRGAVPPGFSHLPAPPKPLLTYPLDTVTQTATGADDTGGRVRLYTSETLGGAKTQVGDAAWEAEHEWGPYETWDGSYVWVSEIGNGTDYAGESPLSDPLDFT